MRNDDEQRDDSERGCEFCGRAFNRPDGDEPFVCPYCGQRWIGPKAVDPQPDNGEGR